jgi:hypothetical protein
MRTPSTPSAGSNRIRAKCPKCGNREPKEVVGIGRSLRLYCASCGNDFAQNKGMGPFTLFFALGALAFAVVVYKQRLAIPPSSNTEYVEIDDVTAPRGERNDPNSPINATQPPAKRKTDTMSTSEREIRKKWGWDNNGTSLNQPAQ